MRKVNLKKIFFSSNSDEKEWEKQQQQKNSEMDEKIFFEINSNLLGKINENDFLIVKIQNKTKKI